MRCEQATSNDAASAAEDAADVAGEATTGTSPQDGVDVVHVAGGSSEVQQQASSSSDSQLAHPESAPSWWSNLVDHRVLKYEVYEEMERLVTNQARLTEGDPTQQLDWILFGYLYLTDNFESLNPTYRGWPCEIPVVIQQAGQLAVTMQNLIARADDNPLHVTIAKGLARAITILAGGYLPPSLFASHARKVGLTLTRHESSGWAIPNFETHAQFNQVALDLLAGVLNLLEHFKLREPERPPAPALTELAVWKTLNKTRTHRNWETIMLDPAAQRGFYEMTETPLPNSIELCPAKKDISLDNFSPFWTKDAWMTNNVFSWQDEIDIAMLPMDISNPKGAEWPRHTATDRTR